MDDFCYLGAWINSNNKDIEVRIAKAWAALQKMETVWKSKLNENLKVRFFRATVETVLLYGSDTWTLTQALEKRLDGAYTKMLRVVKNVSWQQHLTNDILYGRIPRLTTTIAKKRIQFSGHCWRSKEEVAHKLILWRPRHGERSVGKPTRTFIDQLVDDTGVPEEDLQQAMGDRDVWRKFSHGFPTEVD